MDILGRVFIGFGSAGIYSITAFDLMLLLFINRRESRLGFSTTNASRVRPGFF